MKKVVFVVGVIVLGWGLWIFSSHYPEKYMYTGIQSCGSLFRGVRGTPVYSVKDEFVCNGGVFEEVNRIERDATIAIVLGGITVLATGQMIYRDREKTVL